jgi:hypothetical protein
VTIPSLSINANGDLVFGTIFGDIVQPKAKVYTMNNTTGVLTLLGWQPDYVVSGNLVSFNYTGKTFCDIATFLLNNTTGTDDLRLGRR